MKALHLLKLSITVLALQAASALAQDQFRVTFVGTCRTTDGSGRLITRPFLNRDLVTPCAQANGIANLKSVALTYTVGGNPTTGGDTIDVVNATNGTVICPLYILAFPTTIPTPNGLGSEQLVFIYPGSGGPGTASIGTARLTEQTILNRNGSTNRISVIGKFQLANAATDTSNLALCTGTFVTGARQRTPAAAATTP
ncbi:MAG TPA: hypothetical protein VNZ22_15835 [Bacillota bacterium]|nr:hypothetical protein [Bacillota bacterium]